MAITDREAAEAERRGGYLVKELPGASGVPKSVWHNPRTGQEFPSKAAREKGQPGLPMDEWSLMTYIHKGWLPGPAPEELREAYESQKKEVLYNTAAPRTAKSNDLSAIGGESLQTLVRETVEGMVPDLVKAFKAAMDGPKPSTAPPEKVETKEEEPEVIEETKERLPIESTQLQLL